MQTWRLILSVFLPFTAGYYLAYLFRTINTSISGAIASEFGLGARELGLLASVYFLVIAGAQIPVGVLLDRCGARRVQGVLLVIAAGGATLFGTATGLTELVIGRAMVGLGVSAALMAGLKATVMWFPRERVALVNGYMIMLGTLGAATATAPTAWLQGFIGWRGLFEILTWATVIVAGVVHFVVPERAAGSDTLSTARGSPLTLKAVFSDPRFWRIALLSASCIGSSWAMQSLWAGPWLSDVEGLGRQSVVRQLFFMAIGISIGAWLLGTLADRLRRRGVGTEVLLAAVAMLFVAAELALIVRVPLPSLLPWSVVSIVGAATVLSFAVIADYFPVALAARANGALNLLHFAWAFVVQSGVGFIIGQWSPEGGHYPLAAYQTAFGLSLAFQIVALLWFVMPWLLALARHVSRSPKLRRSTSNALPEPGSFTTEGMIFEAQGTEW